MKDKSLAEFVSNNLGLIKNSLELNGFDIKEEITLTQDGCGTITAWPEGFSEELWHEKSMWFASSSERTEKSSNLFSIRTVFEGFNTDRVCMDEGYLFMNYSVDEANIIPINSTDH